MKVSGRVNRFRRRVMSFLTNNLGKDKYKSGNMRREEVKSVLISRPNSRLGNQLLITPLVQEVSAFFPNCRIDLFVRGGVTPVLFQNYPEIDRIIKLPKKPFKELFSYLKTWSTLRNRRYDIAINVIKGSSSGRLSVLFARADNKFYNDPVGELETQYGDYPHMAKAPVYNLRHAMRCLGFGDRTGIPVPALNIRLSLEEIAGGKEVLHAIVPAGRKTIGIYTFATGNKCYSPAWWQELYEKLRVEYGAEYNILEVLPVENVSQIDFSAPSYYSKDIREIAAVIANLELFLLADSGIMHLGSATETPVVGLFSVTNIDRYRPYNGSSIAIDTKTADVDEIVVSAGKILLH